MTRLLPGANCLGFLPLLLAAGCDSSGIDALQGVWTGKIICLSSAMAAPDESALQLVLRAEGGELRGEANIRSKGSNIYFTLTGRQTTVEELAGCTRTCTTSADCAGVLDELGRPGKSSCPQAALSCSPCYAPSLTECSISCTADAQCASILDGGGKAGTSRCLEPQPRYCFPCYERKLSDAEITRCTTNSQCLECLDQNGKKGVSSCLSSICLPCYRRRLTACEKWVSCSADSDCAAVLDLYGQTGRSSCVPPSQRRCSPCFQPGSELNGCARPCKVDGDCAGVLDRLGNAGSSLCVQSEATCTPCYEKRTSEQGVTIELRQGGATPVQLKLSRMGDSLMEGTVSGFCPAGYASKVSVTKR